MEEILESLCGESLKKIIGRLVGIFFFFTLIRLVIYSSTKSIRLGETLNFVGIFEPVEYSNFTNFLILK